MTVREIIEIVLMLIIFFSGFVPLVLGIIYYARENRRMDREAREESIKAASPRGF